MDIVVSRYKENLNWINDVYQEYNFIIYNKSNIYPIEIDNLIKNNKVKYYTLENVGRESHTYLHYIITHYDKLPNKIFFTQADPFDHLVKNQVVEPSFFINILKKYFEGDGEFKGYGAKHYLWKIGMGDKKQLICREIYEKLFKNEFEDWYFNNGGIFGVKKENILLRSKDFYEESIKYLIKSSDPLEGFCFERLWVCIFNNKYLSK